MVDSWISLHWNPHWSSTSKFSFANMLFTNCVNMYLYYSTLVLEYGSVTFLYEDDLIDYAFTRGYLYFRKNRDRIQFFKKMNVIVTVAITAKKLSCITIHQKRNGNISRGGIVAVFRQKSSRRFFQLERYWPVYFGIRMGYLLSTIS